MRTSVATGASLLLLGVLACAGPQPAPLQDPGDPPGVDRVVEVVAERFAFAPAEITVAAGEVVQIRLRSEDTDHGFRIVGAGIDVAIPKRNRGLASVVFGPREPGEYRFECSRVCGAGHSYMRGVIRVTAAGDPDPRGERP